MTSSSMYVCMHVCMYVDRRGNTYAVDQRLLSYRRQDKELIVLAEKHSDHGLFDWKNVSTELGHGMTNSQCSRRWNKLILQGKVIIDEAVYMTTWFTPNLSYDYTDDVEKAYNNQRKKGSGESIIWSIELV